MKEQGDKNRKATIANLGFSNTTALWNLERDQLIQKTLDLELGVLNDTGALCIETGEFTGRSPKDRFIVEDDLTRNSVDWNDINQPFSPEKFDQLQKKVVEYMDSLPEVYVRDVYACADENYRLKIRVINDTPWANLFSDNMFIRPNKEEIASFENDWLILCAPAFHADPAVDGTRQHNFSLINFTTKTILIGGSSYTGEIKKGIFSVLNFILPHQENVLSMHCSANIGKNNDTALFFGLSGTGKTTLSSDPNRRLIGDDEHGWDDSSVFNFEGGCYAKCIDLSRDKEPQIFDAIKFGSLLENINFKEDTSEVDFENSDKTENTRVSYPITYIDNTQEGSIGGPPKNIFFLTCDAYGVLPPISKLTKGQAMYHFISGYTAKVAGTEAGITEPQTAFSACFGAPFMPLHPTKYAEMLGSQMDKENVNVWLVNTGWSGGEYGTGSRIKLSYTREMITAALEGKLNDVEYNTHEVFGLAMPVECPNVPSDILNPKNTWEDKNAYDKKADQLASSFVENFQQYAEYANGEILDAAPKASATA